MFPVLDRSVEHGIQKLTWAITRVSRLHANSPLREFTDTMNEIEPYVEQFLWWEIERTRKVIHDLVEFSTHPDERLAQFMRELENDSTTGFEMNDHARQSRMNRLLYDYQVDKPQWVLEQMTVFTKLITEEIQTRRRALTMYSSLTPRYIQPPPLRIDRIPCRTFTLLGMQLQYRKADRVFLFGKGSLVRPTVSGRKLIIGMLSVRLRHEIYSDVHWSMNREWAELVKHTCRNPELKKILGKFLLTALGVCAVGCSTKEYEKVLRWQKAEVFLAHWRLPSDVTLRVLDFI